ncbi:MAG TPA: hypothetical protein VKQ72_04015 [Aggregatilineales bacterium]|nr:hypothetical protein [Aggregatilineales bacterium]
MTVIGEAFNIDYPCPFCKHTNWQPGTLTFAANTGAGFVPDYNKIVFRGYTIQPFVCRDCGYVANFLAMKDVQHMREKTPRKRKPKE